MDIDSFFLIPTLIPDLRRCLNPSSPVQIRRALHSTLQSLLHDPSTLSLVSSNSPLGLPTPAVPPPAISSLLVARPTSPFSLEVWISESPFEPSFQVQSLCITIAVGVRSSLMCFPL
ncbi:unnamed protein product [Linum trigynum]|uniref:Uncharacterized protein n=1 Tax=Linum trigynum TaxID=586398 RepID=A0AAV2FNC0_9ROSI